VVRSVPAFSVVMSQYNSKNTLKIGPYLPKLYPRNKIRTLLWPMV